MTLKIKRVNILEILKIIGIKKKLKKKYLYQVLTIYIIPPKVI